MEERTIKLTLEKAKEFYQKGGELRNIALSAFTEEELTEVELPKTWEEFCEKYLIEEEEAFIDETSNIIKSEGKYKRHSSIDKNLLPSKEAAEAHLAHMQLHQLRNRYRQGWTPNNDNTKYSIERNICGFHIEAYTTVYRFLSFQTEEIAEKFLNNFKDLIEKAGDLI